MKPRSWWMRSAIIFLVIAIVALVAFMRGAGGQLPQEDRYLGVRTLAPILEKVTSAAVSVSVAYSVSGP